jgi:two-component system KDP operon response regulator KdpE
MSQDLTSMKTVLIIESQQQASRFLRSLLQESFRVLTAGDVRRALPVIQEESPDLIVVNLTSLGSSGPTFCRELRNWSSAPILAISNLPEERLIIEALDAGADGFVTLPLKPGELMARVRALLRWRGSRPQIHDIIRSGDLEIDLPQRRVLVAGKAVRLTRTEFNILAFLARNHERAVPTETILVNVWGPLRGNYTQSLRVHIGHIRRKIEPDPLHPRYLITHRGGRYRLSGVAKQSEGEES